MCAVSHRRLRLQVRGHGVVVILLADRIRFDQRLVALCKRLCRSIRRHGAVVTCLVGRRVDLIELLPCLDILTFDEQPLQNDAVDLWPHVGGTVAVHASGQLGGDRHRLSMHGDDRDFRRWRGRRRSLLPTAREHYHGQEGEVNHDHDPGSEATASRPEPARVSKTSDTGLRRSHGLPPWSSWSTLSPERLSSDSLRRSTICHRTIYLGVAYEPSCRSRYQLAE